MKTLRDMTMGELMAWSPTDCVKDRLAACFHWSDLECFEPAGPVAKGAEVDLAEIERWALKAEQEGKFARFKERYAR